MASIHSQTNAAGTTYRVRWRDDGRQQSLSFADQLAAQDFKADIEQYGPTEALRILELKEREQETQTVSDFLLQHIDSLTGVQPATLNRYKTFVSRDITPAFGSLPLQAVTENTVARWVQKLETEGRKIRGKQAKLSAKTIANLHGFLSGAFNAATKQGLIPSNPCLGRRLPEGQREDMVLLERAEFDLLLSCMPEHWRPFTVWLVTTGMRFSEATALTPLDVDRKHCTCRINKAFKYTGRHGGTIGPPKTKKSNRTISLSKASMDCIDLDTPYERLFTNPTGNPVTAQDFFKNGWRSARAKARELGLTKWPRPHDLRHTHASWLINAGTPLPVVSQRLGHQSITVTVGMYWHLDQRSERQAAALIDNILTEPLPTANAIGDILNP